MNNIKTFSGALLIIMLLCFSPLQPLSHADEKVQTPPPPQLVTNAWMFMAAYKADPDVLKEVLPRGLTPHPNNQVVINMYTVPDANNTSGFGSYTLTYLTIEIDEHDSYTMGDGPDIPGRYFIYYFNSSELMRNFTRMVGIPAEEGQTTTEVEEGRLTAKLTVDGEVLIEATADVGDELGNFGGGHLNYFGLNEFEKGTSSTKQVMKYPIPWNGGVVSTENAKIDFKVTDEHPLSRLKPLGDPSWAIWTKGSFVYPQPQIILEYSTQQND